jgi:hypothetical protein
VLYVVKHLYAFYAKITYVVKKSFLKEHSQRYVTEKGKNRRERPGEKIPAITLNASDLDGR